MFESMRDFSGSEPGFASELELTQEGSAVEDEGKDFFLQFLEEFFFAQLRRDCWGAAVSTGNGAYLKFKLGAGRKFKSY